MEIHKSDIVLSEAGRDKGMLFFVIDTDGVYVSLANGKERKLEPPKRKKLRDVSLALQPDSSAAVKIRSGDRVLNSELRRELAIIGQEFNVQTKEVS